MMQPAGALERALRRDRVIVLAAAGTVTLFAAVYTVVGVGMSMSAVEMTRMARDIGAPMQMAMVPEWTFSHAVLIFLMWWIMMIAMMTPSAAPALLLFAAVKRRSSVRSASLIASWLFLSGYVVAWAAFSALATALQWVLQAAGVLAPAMMTLEGRSLATAVLVAAGLYQMSALKASCLAQCRSPADFLLRHRRPGLAGAFVMGAHHGLFCLGCCWALMTLLFVGGIMNLWWIVGLALLVAIEKLVEGTGPWLPRAIGGALIALSLAVAGGWM